MKKIRPAFKCQGGKFSLVDWIISNFPEDYPNYTYLEPFGGGISVLVNKTKSPQEAVSDADGTIVLLLRAIRDEPKELVRRLNLVKHCPETFERATKRTDQTFDDYLDHAVNEYILRRMSRDGEKKVYHKGEMSAWKASVAELLPLADRIKEVYLINKPAIGVIESFNDKKVLLYADPPCLHERHDEMDADDHIELFRALDGFAGKVVLSGNPCPLYSRLYKDWKKVVFNKKGSKQATLWKNF